MSNLNNAPKQNDWETLEKYDNDHSYSIINGTLHIPETIDEDWIKRYFTSFFKHPHIWTLIKNKIKSSSWVCQLYDIFTEEIDGIDKKDRDTFLSIFSENFPEKFKILHVLKISTANYDSYIQLRDNACFAETCLSGLNLSGEIKGKIFVDISDKSDVSDLYKNITINNEKNKYNSHIYTVSALYEIAEIVNKKHKGPKVRAWQHCRTYEDPIKGTQKYNFSYDKSKLKGFNQSDTDLCVPPKKKGWTKNCIMDIISGNKIKIIQSLISDQLVTPNMITMSENELYEVIKNNILSYNDYSKLHAQVSLCDSPVKHGKQKEAFALKVKFTLDQWQIDFITKSVPKNKDAELIHQVNYQKDSDVKCILLQGPTSGGKTYASMGVIDRLLAKYKEMDRKKSTIVYCTPNFYLAIQTYSIINNTFSNNNMGLVTKGILDIPAEINGVRVIVGTPKELWSLMCKGDKINVLIIDEIHMIGNSDCWNKDKQSMSNLIGMTRDQVIGLSATIHSEDIKVLEDHIIKTMGCNKKIETISYGNRPVPLYPHVFNGKIVPAGDEIKFCEITVEKTKELLIELKKDDKSPTLIFDENDRSCFKHYRALVKHLEEEEKENFPLWLELLKINQDIKSYNMKSQNNYNIYKEDYTKNKSEKINKQCSEIKKHAVHKTAVAAKVLDYIISLIIDGIKKNKGKYKRRMTNDEIVMLRYIKNHSKLNISVEEYSQIELDYDVLQLFPYYDIYKDISKTIENSVKLSPESISPVPEIPNIAPEYLILGKNVGARSIIDIIDACKSKDKNNKTYNNFVEMCYSERCDVENVKKLYKLLAKGLKFGIAILIESVPYVIQLKIMSLLKNKEIEIIFASQAMRMGIDFPIRSCVIRADTLKPLDICSVLQMAGRAGRRRKDTEGHVIYWNIENFKDAKPENLPRLKIPKHNDTLPNLEHDLKTSGYTGFYINDYNCILDIITKIKDLEDIEQHIKSLSENYENYKYSIQKDNYITLEDDDGECCEDDVPREDGDFSIQVKGNEKINKKQVAPKDVELSKQIFGSIIKTISEYLTLDDDVKNNSRTVRVKSIIIQKIVNYTLENRSLSELLSNSDGRLSDEKIVDIIYDIQEWLNIIQELHMMNRHSKIKNVLKLLKILFEILHQSKYRIISITI